MTGLATKMPPPPTLDIHGAFVPAADLSFANLSNANLADANAKNALFVGSNMKGAILDNTNLVGADFTDAKNLTEAQLSKAIIDDTTILPPYIDRAKLQ